MNVRKKLIEVALPLEAINIASAREKSIRHGHPSTLHLWWARRPLAAARAVIFSQMVDDPSEYVQELTSPATESRKVADRELKKRLVAWEARPSKESATAKPTLDDVAADIERQRLFGIIEELVQWENTTNEEVVQKARDEIWRSWRRTCAENADHPRAKEFFDRDKLPAFHDPFAGGGALPLEAQRLGLESFASDLNPVAVLINKAMIEIPPIFAGKPPVNPDAQASLQLKTWQAAQGMAEDVLYYGNWMKEKAEELIGKLYPKVRVTPQMATERPDLTPYLNRDLAAVAWIWARTVKSPNPAFREKDVPLASTFMLCTKAGKEAYVQPVVADGTYHFEVRRGRPTDLDSVSHGTKMERGSNFECILSGTPIGGDYIKAEGQAGRMGTRLMAIVLEGDRGRLYISPSQEQETLATSAHSGWRPEGNVPARLTGGTCVPYGLRTWGDLFSQRQLVSLTTFSDLVGSAMTQIKRDAIIAGFGEDQDPLTEGGSGAEAYAQAIGTYLGFGVSRAADAWSSIVTWRNQAEASRGTFARQAIPMTWDFAEVNPFSDSCGHWLGNSIDWVRKSLLSLPRGAPSGKAAPSDAASQTISETKVVSTDPPYYDNIGYADLSDFFYVWLRRSLRAVHSGLFATMAVPKDEELVATAYRHGGRESAEQFFLTGMTKAMDRICQQAHPAFPVTIYYAFKQSESTEGGGQASTGWETFLEAVIRSGFSLTGTWPMRTEKPGRVLSNDTNALASSIILVCRRRAANASNASRREFHLALAKELPSAIADLQRGNVAPVDLQQAAIGPGMAIFTRYDKVLDADGKRLSVRDALAMINEALDNVLAHQEGDFDADTRWALVWFQEHGFAEGPFGKADDLARARNTSVEGIRQAGIGTHGQGKVRLFRPEELSPNWTPEGDKRLTVWDMVHHLIRVLDQGEDKAAEILVRLGPSAEVARELAYRLYAICDRTKRGTDAQRYNALVQSWPEILRLSQQIPERLPEGQQAFEGME